MGTNESPPLKRKKKNDLYKPPTNEEINQMKEAETLYKSNLFRMQISELINEVQLPEKKKQQLEPLLHSLNNTLSDLKPLGPIISGDKSWLPGGLAVPMPERSGVWTEKDKCLLEKPEVVSIVGSYLLSTCVRPDISIDMALQIPKSLLDSKDYLNHKYHHKRARYLAYIASALKVNPLVEELSFTYFDGDYLKPVLLIKPAGKLGKHFTIQLFPCIAGDTFKTTRFHPNQNNVRRKWFLGTEGPDPPTPHYNQSLAADAFMVDHLQFLHSAMANFPSLRDSIILLKVWLQQRQLNQGIGRFSGFVLSMLTAYLLSVRKINKMMSSYQVLRNTLHFIANSDWTQSGISLKQGVDLAEFHRHFSVVFVDTSGFVNLCARINTATYRMLQHEAQVSVRLLDQKNMDSFSCLLLQPVPFIAKYDHFFHLTNLIQLVSVCEKLNLGDSLLDFSGNAVFASLPKLLALLTRALGKRIHLLGLKPIEASKWNCKEKPPKFTDIPKLTFGLLLDTEFSNSPLDRGPAANTPEAKEFRQLWGPVCELRRFHDGSITEAVVWPGDTIAQRRLVCCHVVKHTLKWHAGLHSDNVQYVGNQLEAVLRAQSTSGKAEEQNLAAVQVYNDLNKQLRQLEGLPLSIHSIQGVSPTLRFTEVSVPLPAIVPTGLEKANGCYLPPPAGPCPPWTPAMKVTCQLESSSKWPDDLEAIKQIKTAFHLKLAQLLKKQFSLSAAATTQHVDVLKEGYVFRVQLVYSREVHLLKQSTNAEGLLVTKDNQDSRRLETDAIFLPRLSSTLYGVQQQHSTFSATARLAKRWAASQLLLGAHLGEEAVELMVAHLYTSPAPLACPSSPLTGLLRFLHLVYSHDWKSSPLLINFNDELTASECDDIRDKFAKSRSQYPVMCLATSVDRFMSVWTKHTPTVQILKRLCVLAEKSASILEQEVSDFKAKFDFKIFRPSLDMYDVVIHLKKACLARGAQPGGAAPVCRATLPVVEFDPVQCYMAELQASFGQSALFFLDIYGGDSIGVLWHPDTLKEHPFKVSEMVSKIPISMTKSEPGNEKVSSSNSDKLVVFNMEAALQDFHSLGQGLVSSIEIRSEKWT